MKTIDELLAEALDKVAAKDVKAAKKIYESALTTEEKLVATEQLLDKPAKKHAWMAAESATGHGKLVEEIRESSYAFRPSVVKHNGVLDNMIGVRESTDDNKNELVYEAARRSGMTEVEARIFANMDDDGAKITAAILKEGGR